MSIERIEKLSLRCPIKIPPPRLKEREEINAITAEDGNELSLEKIKEEQKTTE